MSYGITGFIFGAILAVLVCAVFYSTKSPLKPAPVSAEIKLFADTGPCVIPRCDSLAPTGDAEAWGKSGFRVNVLWDVSEEPSESDQIPARVFSAWNKEGFLARVEVDTPQTDEAEKDDQLWNGDSVELFFFTGSDLKQSCHVTVAPGLDPKHPAQRQVIEVNPKADPKVMTVKTEAHRTPKGYAVEFSIPWNTFGLTPAMGQKCAVQVLVNHKEAGTLRHFGWYPDSNTSRNPEQKMDVVLGEAASPPIDVLTRMTMLTPRTGQVVFKLAPEIELGHVLTVRHGDEILYCHEVNNGIFFFTDYFPLPAAWKDSTPVVACDNDKVLATLTREDVRASIKSLANDLSYRFNPSVFGENEFPKGEFDQDDLVRSFFAPVKVTTTFYDAQYHEVTQPDKPGRYGAVVRISLSDGVEVQRFITLYHTPTKINWRGMALPISAQLPPELGLNPAVLHAQKDMINEAVRGTVTYGIRETSNLAILLAGLSEIPPGAPPAVERTDAETRDADWWFGLRRQIGLALTYSYLADLPADYAADPNKRWPLILFLHGSGERGDHVEDVRRNGLAKLMGQGKTLPAIVISPQCPAHSWWQTPVLSQLLDDLSAKYRIDPDRIYVTGLSMGGFGTWSLALAHPERFAAIATVCGGGDPPDAGRLKNLPVWSFHGGKDPTVPIRMTIDMVEAVRKAGGHAHLTIFPEAYHDSWTQAYDTEALYPWLLAQKRGQPEVRTPDVPTP